MQNQIKEIPKEIGQLVNLQTLNLYLKPNKRNTKRNWINLLICKELYLY